MFLPSPEPHPTEVSRCAAVYRVSITVDLQDLKDAHPVEIE